MKSSPMTTWSRKAARGWYILRYYRPSQLAARLVSIARRRYESVCGAGGYASFPAAPPAIRSHAGLERIASARLEARPSDAAAATGVLESRFCFLNIQRELPDPIDWRLECWPDAPHLWRFHLHYHEFLLDLAAKGVGSLFPCRLDAVAHCQSGLPDMEKDSRPLSARAWEIVLQWIEDNPLSDPRVLLDAWHPYCISRRLPVWICLWITVPPDGVLRDRVLASMHLQARYLADHLEHDLGGNHLLENLRALTLAGCFLDCEEAARWRQSAGRLVEQELAVQVLPHGEHFERSPMYHAAMLEAVLDLRDAAEDLMPQTARLAAETAARMSGFLEEVLHPDGDIPLLGDSCFGETPSPARLLARVSARESFNRKPEASAPAGALASGLRLNEVPRSAAAQVLGDYWIYRDEESHVLLDAGPVGPDHLPAHAHADLLSFEASFRGARLFVDSGVSSYQDDEVRRYCRSTAAHNVLEIDGTDQCDMWSKFRMGYRGWPLGLTTGETGGFSWARACHNAYRRIGVPTVGRWFACRPGGPWFCVDWAEGKGEHRCTNRLHLHPDVAVEQVADGDLNLQLAETTLPLRFLTPGEVTVTEGWYCPAMGCRRPAPVICWTASTVLPAVCGWSLTWASEPGTAILEKVGTDGRFVEGGLKIRPAGWRLRWTDASGPTELWPIEGAGSS